MLGNTSFSPWYKETAYRCSVFKVSNIINTTNNVIKVLLLLPLSFLVLFHAHQKWQQHRSFNTSSLSDIFNYHLAAMELIWVFGCLFFLAGLHTDHALILTVGMYFCYMPFYGEMVFNLLTCVERYLAVVHPHTYHGLKNYHGIRNISMGCSWLLCFALTVMFRGLQVQNKIIFVLFFLVFSILTISFCSISVLCILIRPGPGEGGGDKDRVDRSRRRAFYTITLISSVVWLWFVGLIACHSFNGSGLVSDSVECLVIAVISWFGLPCSFVSPLLHLHKTRKWLKSVAGRCSIYCEQ